MSKFDKQKEAMLQALEKSMGVVTTACKSSNTPRSTHYKWLNEDEEYRAAVNEATAIAGDFVESKLYQAINDGNISAIIFYCKTKLKDRGYVERTEVSGVGDTPISIQIIET